METISTILQKQLDQIFKKCLGEDSTTYFQSISDGKDLGIGTIKELVSDINLFGNIVPIVGEEYEPSTILVLDAIQIIIDQIQPPSNPDSLFYTVKNEVEKLKSQGLQAPALRLSCSGVLIDILVPDVNNVSPFFPQSVLADIPQADQISPSSIMAKFTSLKLVSFSRGNWFNTDLLTKYQNGPWIQNSSFDKNKSTPFGNNGLLPLVVIKVLMGTNPSIKISFQESSQLELYISWLRKTYHGKKMKIGPFLFSPDSNNTDISTDHTNNTVTIADLSGLLKIYAVNNLIMP